MAWNYSTDIKRPDLVKAVGRGLGISTKQSVEVSRLLRGKRLKRARTILENVIAGKQAVPYRRFNDNVGHKTGIGPGRYPKKTCLEILELLHKIEASASQKGLDASAMVITHISAHRAGKQPHYGRQSRRIMKRTHVEVVAESRAEPKKDKTSK